MRNVVTKLYERNCGDAGKFIVLEAGRENADGLYEGVSMYGHYFVDSNYDSETGIIMIEINGDVNLINELIGRLAIKGFNVEAIQ